MRVAVTGGTGFIGQYLIKEYGDRIDFIVPTRQKLYSELEPRAEYICTSYEMEGFREIFRGCDAVVHLGGRVMHGMNFDLSTKPYMDNITLSNNVFEACKELDIKNIINASSVAVYDQVNETPVKETAPCQPNSIYGIMKITVEKLAELYNRRYGLKIKSYRFAQGIGLQSRMNTKQFWSILLKKSLEGKAIPLYGKGKTGRDIIYVKDMALAIVLGLQQQEISGCFNIGTGHICSNLEIAEVYCEVFGNEQGIVFVDETETGIRTCMDCQKAKEFLSFVPQYDVRKMVIDIKDEFKKRNAIGKSVIFY